MESTNKFWHEVHRIASESGISLEEQISQLLRIACRRYQMDVGLVTLIDDGNCKTLSSYETNTQIFKRGSVFPLAGTACAQVVNETSVIRLYPETPTYIQGMKEPVQFNAYLGKAIRIDGRVFGTLCFSRLEEKEKSLDQISNDEVNILMLIVAALIERELHLKSERELRDIASIVECSEVAIYAWTPDRVITTWNESAQTLYGYAADDVIGKSDDILYPDDQRERIDAVLSRALKGERTSTLETIHRRKDGEPVHVSMNVSPLLDEDGNVASVSVLARNIGERKRAELALANSEQRYALAAKGANDGLWDWDLKSNKVYYSPRWKAILGYEEDELDDRPEAWISQIDSTDVEKFQADLQAHLTGHTDQLYNEHRVITRSGELIWVLCRGVVVRDNKGDPIRIAGSLTDINRQKQTEYALMKQAQHDRLTGLPNRFLFSEILGKALARTKRSSGYQFAVLFLDFDRFKVINDSLGHEYGDMLLVSIAQQLRLQLRTVDIAARLGGDEFVVLLDGVDGIEGAMESAERLLEAFSKPHKLGDHEITSTASIGVVTSKETYTRPDEVIRDADAAMYQAKSAGKARAVIFDEEMHARALQRLLLEKDLSKAIALGQMSLVYQPIICLESGALRGFEALIRWNHPEYGWISPDQFITIAEETGAILQIGHWVIEQACRQLKEWHHLGPDTRDLYVNINASKRQIAHHDFVDHLSETIKRLELNPTKIKIEITESAIMNDQEGITPVLEAVRALGVELAMDDFGTGHSSLSCLHRFPIDVLKIDREFINNIEQSLEYAAVVQAIVTLAHTLGISVVAEGLETAEQVAMLQALECDSAQGYYFAKPLPAKETADYILGKDQLKKSA